MESATGALGTLLPKLAQLLQDEYKLQKGVKKDIQFLHRELETMHAALRTVGEVPLEQLSEQVKIWARDVRELSYDMEDIVDTFLVRVQGSEPTSKRNAKRFIKKMMSVVTKAVTRHEIANEIKDIKERVKDVAERRDRHKVDAITPVKTLVDPRLTALYTKSTNLVGINEATEELITRLMKEDDTSEQQRRVSIVGFGGLGKTTLAKAVYDKIKDQFKCKAFVSVSRNPDVGKIMKDMLYEFDKDLYRDIHNTKMDEKHLMDQVQEFLQDKRYLIVVDDIWDKSAWEILKCALPENSLKSRIITTTRIIHVAEHVGGCYKMKPLTDKMSKLLFYGRVFGTEGKCPHQFLEISKKILKKCGGVPLAIITTSSLLANKSRDIKLWNDVCDSISFGLGNNSDMDSMWKILLLSYYDLPPHLKTCLLYLSVFPEDYKIERDRLIWRWIAEGFVQSKKGCESLFEIGLNYFNELLNRSMIQPDVIDKYDRDPLACRIHDIVLDLICSLAEEESFATNVSTDYKQNTSSLGSKVRRLSLYCSTWPTKIDTSKMRSLTISRPSIINSMPPMSCYKFLRVLDLQDCKLNDHPSLEFVGKLFHLRYLSLRDTNYKGEVEEEIGKLMFLQTLDLRGTKIKELPLGILELTQLKSLYVEGDSTRLPNGLRNLSSLEVLWYVQVDSADIAEELGHLTDLRTLRVGLTREGKEDSWVESTCKVLAGSIGKLHKIQTLAVDSDGVVIGLVGSLESPLYSLCNLSIKETSCLPTWIDPASFLFLAQVEVDVGQLRGEDMDVLGKLQALRWLKVRVVGCESEKVVERFRVSTDAFPCVTHCKFVGFSMVPSMFTVGAMPRLQYFKSEARLKDFYGAGAFTVDDLAFGHLPSLHTVRVHISGEESWVVSEDDVVTKAEEVLRHEAYVHPNHPETYIRCYGWIGWFQCIEDSILKSDSRKLQRLEWRAERLRRRMYRHQLHHFAMWHEARKMREQLRMVITTDSSTDVGDDAKHKVERFLEQLQQVYFNVKDLKVVEDEPRELKAETIAEMERFTTMLEELRTAFSLLKEDVRADKIANNQSTEEKMAEEVSAGTLADGGEGEHPNLIHLSKQ